MKPDIWYKANELVEVLGGNVDVLNVKRDIYFMRTMTERMEGVAML